MITTSAWAAASWEVRGVPTSATRTSKPWLSKKRVNQRPICPLPPIMAMVGFILTFMSEAYEKS